VPSPTPGRKHDCLRAWRVVRRRRGSALRRSAALQRPCAQAAPGPQDHVKAVSSSLGGGGGGGGSSSARSAVMGEGGRPANGGGGGGGGGEGGGDGGAKATPPGLECASRAKTADRRCTSKSGTSAPAASGASGRLSRSSSWSKYFIYCVAAARRRIRMGADLSPRVGGLMSMYLNSEHGVLMTARSAGKRAALGCRPATPAATRGRQRLLDIMKGRSMSY
jgi:hypothetical protein